MIIALLSIIAFVLIFGGDTFLELLVLLFKAAGYLFLMSLLVGAILIAIGASV